MKQDEHAPNSLPVGTLLAGRFEVQSLAGAGGMADVYRALDRETGATIAIKWLRDSQDVERFQLEERVLRHLSKLAHPGIVRLVARGGDFEGLPFMAMEWLDGGDLARYLHGRRLSVAESLALTRRVASALEVAHAEGIVHRDLKPSNLIVAGDLTQLKVVDFGIARVETGAARQTLAGGILGTPDYMAPEQARGELDIDARADIFSLGCILFECLAGEPPFSGAHVMAVLAKILLLDPPDLRTLRPEVPLWVCDLVGRMLTKDRNGRPPSARAIVSEIDFAEEPTDPERQPPIAALRTQTVQREALSRHERRLITIMMCRARSASLLPAARDAATTIGAGLEVLRDEITVVLTLVDTEDSANRMASAALALLSAAPSASLAIATGRADVSVATPFGAAIDRAAGMLRFVGKICIDDTTAALMGDRARAGHAGPDSFLLESSERAKERTHTLLGRRTPCMGRESELAWLRGQLQQVSQHTKARAAIVTGPAGIGKSRVLAELLCTAPASSFTSWLAVLDPTSTEFPLGLITQLVLSAAGVPAGADPASIRRRVRSLVPQETAEDSERCSAFLDELLGVSDPETLSPMVLAARGDPRLMNQQLLDAFLGLVRSAALQGPVVVVVEDLHWSDRASARYLAEMLESLVEHAVFFLASARSEVARALPDLFSIAQLVLLPLPDLPRGAAETLVREALGPSCDEHTMARIVALASGNAFYLEELIRFAATASPGQTTLPDSVLAMADHRIAALRPEARRVVRAGAILGARFWPEAIATLVDLPSAQVAPIMEHLVRDEIFERRAESRLPGRSEFGFRQALVREAAYATLTAPDRSLGHRLAGQWLESLGETDAMTLAEHFERGGEREKATIFLLHAVEEARASADTEALVLRAERAVHCGAKGHVLGALRARQAEGCAACGQTQHALDHAREAMSLVDSEASLWADAARQRLVNAARLGDKADVVQVAEQLLEILLRREVAGAHVRAAAIGVMTAYVVGKPSLAENLLGALESAFAQQAAEPATLARVERARASHARHAGDAEAYLSHVRAAAVAYGLAGDSLNEDLIATNIGFACSELGLYEEAERILRRVLERTKRRGRDTAQAVTLENLGRVLSRRGFHAEAQAMLQAVAVTCREHENRRSEGLVRSYLAWSMLASRDVAGAISHATAASELLEGAPVRALALAILSRALRANGDSAAALTPAREANALLETNGGTLEEGEGEVRLAWVLALRASGRPDAAEAALRLARNRLQLRAQAIADPAVRAAFLQNIEEHAQTLALNCEPEAG